MNSLDTTSKSQTLDSGSSLSISRAAATKFAEKWKDTVEEQQNDQAFWQDFFRDLLGISDLQESGVEFQKKVKSSKTDTTTRIDVFWKDTFLVEHKSAGKDLEAAEVQAREYLFSLPPAQRPPIIIICDFARFRIVDYVLNKSHEFRLENLPDNLDRIEAIVSHKTNVAITVQVEADQKAAQLMADLYLQLEKYDYEGHEASVFMVRVLFCLFADDTRMWKSGIFQDLVKDTNEQGSDLGPRLSTLFTVLDTPKDQRRGPQDPFLADFPYVNGGIFSERLDTISFNNPMRQALINACNYDWSTINPTIFGALFQDIKSKAERGANGEHYTTEENIDKTIGPLFIDELHEKLEKAWDNSSKLKELQRELGAYQILDPACGCGNFLITTYKRLRQLELEIIVRIKQLDGTAGQTSLFDVTDDVHVKLEQLHGIEYVEWSSQIAKVAIYLTDHQENMKLEEVLGVAANRFPLSHSANITLGNALQIDWSELCPITDTTIIVGNPPFLGSNWQSDEQRSDSEAIWQGTKGSASLDYVANWYIKAARLVEGTLARVGFVSTNSISQGEQPAVLWKAMFSTGCKIDFAHRSFAWTSDAAGKAGVHCVIIGFSSTKRSSKRAIWSYETPQGIPNKINVDSINPYLSPGNSVVVASRPKPLSNATPPMKYGNMPNEFGYLANIYEEDLEKLIDKNDPALRFIRPLIGASEMINNKKRFCLWLVDATPADLRSSEFIMERVAMVKKLRSESKRKATLELSKTPHLFQEVREQTGDYLAVPIVSSENRDYVPMKIFPKEVVPTNALLTIPNLSLEFFAFLNSSLFNLWLRTVGGRLESRLRMSAEIVYNNFPFPELTDKQTQLLRESAELINQARNIYPDSSLADLYNRATMPKELIKSHAENDKRVRSVFGLSGTLDEASDLAILFEKSTEIIDF